MKSLRGLFPFLSVTVLSLACGLFFTRSGLMTYDTQSHLERSQWIVNKYLGLLNGKHFELHNQLKWYGPLFEIFLGFSSEVLFKFLNDPIWIRFTITFACFPITLFLSYKLLTQSGVSKLTSLLCISLLFGFIRWGGHSLVNPVDFPFSCVFLLIILWSWNYLKKLHMDSVDRNLHISNGSLAYFGVVSISAFMIRPPVITQFFALLGIIFLIGLLSKKKEANPLRFLGVPVISGLSFMWMCWPAIWEKPSYKGWHAWLQSFGGFVRFWWNGDITAYGYIFHSHQLPRWYAFIWPPVNMHPFAFLIMIVGLILSFKSKSPAFSIFLRNNQIFNLSLKRYLAIFTLVAWSGVVLYGPVLYDEDRHLLWLYLPLLILAGLGLDFLSKSIKLFLVLSIFLGSTYSYIFWGRYSYIYKSSLILDTRASQFTGDYWGVCMAPAITQLKTLVESGSKIVVPGPFEIGPLQSDRLHNSRYLSDPTYGNYDFKRDYEAKTLKDYYVVLFNRNSHIETIIAENRPNWSLIWMSHMPLGEPACGIFKVHQP